MLKVITMDPSNDIIEFTVKLNPKDILDIGLFIKYSIINDDFLISRHGGYIKKLLTDLSIYDGSTDNINEILKTNFPLLYKYAESDLCNFDNPITSIGVTKFTIYNYFKETHNNSDFAIISYDFNPSIRFTGFSRGTSFKFPLDVLMNKLKNRLKNKLPSVYQEEIYNTMITCGGVYSLNDNLYELRIHIPSLVKHITHDITYDLINVIIENINNSLKHLSVKLNLDLTDTDYNYYPNETIISLYPVVELL